MSTPEITDPFLLRLKKRIESETNLTEAGLAKKAGLSDSAIRQYFSRSNRTPRIENARKICAALGTTFEEFMTEGQTPEEQEIVRLTAQLSDPLRRQLLGYAQALAASQEQVPPKAVSEEE
jgi:transcriptional regulator with XRE-family HTH domain